MELNNTSGQTIKDTLQRVIEGLQRTLQVFQVISERDIERGNQEPRRVASDSSLQYSVSKRKNESKPKYSRSNRKTFEREVEEKLRLRNFQQFDLESGSSRILSPEIFRPRSYNELLDIKPSIKTNSSKKYPKRKSSKKLTFFIEDKELSGTSSFPRSKGDDRNTFFPSNAGPIFAPFPSGKRKYQDEPEDDVMKRNRSRQRYQKPFFESPKENLAKRRRPEGKQKYKNSSPAGDIALGEKKSRETDKQEQTRSVRKNGKDSGCCKCLDWFRGKKHKRPSKDVKIKYKGPKSKKVKEQGRKKKPLDLKELSSGSEDFSKQITKELKKERLDKYKSQSLLDLESDSKRASKTPRDQEIKKKIPEIRETYKKDEVRQGTFKTIEEPEKPERYKSKSLENLEKISERKTKTPLPSTPSEVQKEKYKEWMEWFEKTRKKQLSECCKPKEQIVIEDGTKPGPSKEGKKLEKKAKSKKRKNTKRDHSRRPQTRREKYRKWLNWFIERRRKKEERVKKKKTRHHGRTSRDTSKAIERDRKTGQLKKIEETRSPRSKEVSELEGKKSTKKDIQPDFADFVERTSPKGKPRKVPSLEDLGTGRKSPRKDIQPDIADFVDRTSPKGKPREVPGLGDLGAGRKSPRKDIQPDFADFVERTSPKGKPRKVPSLDDLGTGRKSPRKDIQPDFADFVDRTSPKGKPREIPGLNDLGTGRKSPRKDIQPDFVDRTSPKGKPREVPALNDLGTGRKSPRKDIQPDFVDRTSPKGKPREVPALNDLGMERKSPRKDIQPDFADYVDRTSPKRKSGELPGLGDLGTGRKSPRKEIEPNLTEGRSPNKGKNPLCATCLEECKVVADAHRKGCTKRETLKKLGNLEPIRDEEESSDLSESYTSLGVGKKGSKEAPYAKKQKVLDVDHFGRSVKADFVLIFLLNLEEQFGSIFESFLQTIQEEGMQLECVVSVDYLDTAFIKVQIPKEVAINLAKKFDIKLACSNPYFEYEKKSRCICKNTELTSDNPTNSVAKRNRAAVRGDKPNEPTSSERIRILYELLKITKFSNELDDFGIWEMKRKGIIADAYPLHDGTWKWTEKGTLNERQLLKKYWAKKTRIFSQQPIQHIYRYFGPEIAYYFAFMDWYMTMLIPLAIAGIINLLYGWATMTNNYLVKQYCVDKTFRNKIMCSICENPKICGFSLFDSCSNFKLTYLFDNTSTIWFGIISSIWGLLFMVIWRRQQNLLKVSWNLHERLEMDLFIRPAYLKRAQKMYISQITGEPELGVTKPKEILYKFFVAGGMLGAIFVVLLVLFLLILFRIKLTAGLAAADKTKITNGVEVQKRSPAVRTTAFTTAIISSIIIVLFSHLFDYVAIFLTNVENPKTQGEYDRSHILKLLLFSCVNHYHMVIYLAFFRSVMYTHPGDVKMWKSFQGINADICDTSGCLLDVVYYITVLLIVKTLANCFYQLVIPKVIPRLWGTSPSNPNCPQWELDFHLASTSPYYISKLNIESVTQYGLVIFFMPAFPLLPLIALIVNAIDTRVNAKGLVQLRRRPISRQICERELWNHILYAMTFIGIIIHGFVGAFLANYIERTTFTKTKMFSPNVTYLDAAFSNFAVEKYVGYENPGTVTECLFFAKRKLTPKGSYETTPYYFQVLGNRLTMVAILLGLVITGGVIFHSVIPTVPYRTQQNINHLENEEIF